MIVLLWNFKRKGGGYCYTISKENTTDIRWKLPMPQSVLYCPSFADDVCL